MFHQMILRAGMAVLMIGALWSPAAKAQGIIEPPSFEASSEKVEFDAQGSGPDVNKIPLLQNIVRSGATLYYMGKRSGLYGWFIVKQGRVQMVYATDDLQTTLVGAMFTAQGANVTGAQIKKLAENNRAIYDLLYGANRQNSQIQDAGGIEGGIASLSSAGGDEKSSSGLPSLSFSPGDRLYKDLQAAAGVELGKENAPEIMIVVAPNCPNCKGTWRELRSAVETGTARVRLIPVYNSLGGEEANEAAMLLTAKDPYKAWDRYVSGDKTALAGEPEALALKAVMANLKLVTKWNIKGYPYLVYKNKEGKVKIVQGRPERIAPLLLDITR